MKNNRFAALLTGILFGVMPAGVLAGCACGEALVRAQDGAAEAVGKEEIVCISPTENGEVQLMNDVVREFLGNYSEGYSKKWKNPGDLYKMKEVELSWEAEGAVCYTVSVGRDLAFHIAEKYVTAKNSLSVGNLIPGATYYWKVKAMYADGSEAVSDIFSFRTEEGLRQIDIEGVSNSRDLGGVEAFGGQRVKYGMIYRSATLENITPAGIYECRQLGIRTELDIRNGGEGGAGERSPLGYVKYIHVPGAAYTYPDLGFNDETNRAHFREEIRAVADADNYPLLFHCSVGRDRTGTLAAVLYALLGVSEEDILKDYELSFLSAAGTQDGSDANTMVNSCKMVIGYLYGFGGETLRECTENFLLYIGVTQAEIDGIRNILLA